MTPQQLVANYSGPKRYGSSEHFRWYLDRYRSREYLRSYPSRYSRGSQAWYCLNRGFVNGVVDYIQNNSINSHHHGLNGHEHCLTPSPTEDEG